MVHARTFFSHVDGWWYSILSFFASNQERRAARVGRCVARGEMIEGFAARLMREEYGHEAVFNGRRWVVSSKGC